MIVKQTSKTWVNRIATVNGANKRVFTFKHASDLGAAILCSVRESVYLFREHIIRRHPGMSFCLESGQSHMPFGMSLGIRIRGSPLVLVFSRRHS